MTDEIANAILVLAASLDRVAEALTANTATPRSGPGAAPGGPPAPQGAPASNGDSAQVKRGKKIYAICRNNDWDIADIGQRVTNHAMAPNSQKWSEADQIAVLDAFSEWGVG